MVKNVWFKKRGFNYVYTENHGRLHQSVPRLA